MAFQVAQTDCPRPLEAANLGSPRDLMIVGSASEIHDIPNIAAWRGRTNLCEIGSTTGMPQVLIREVMIGLPREVHTMTEIV